MRQASHFATLLFVALCVIGCGKKGEFDTTSVSGTVTFDGQPVTEGTLDFIPVASGDQRMMGKPAAASIHADGSYSAGTYGEHDGVVPGMKKVRYSAPLPADTRDAAQAAPSKFIGMEIEPSEIEVSPNGGEFNFELKKPAKKR